MFQKESPSAFTLIELLVVISIIAILSTLSVVALNNARSKARDARRLSDIKQINLALDLYYNEFGIYPASPGSVDSNITGLCLSDLGISSTCGAVVYLQKIPNDPLNNVDYQYRQLSGGVNYRLFAQLENDNSEYPGGVISMGPNGHSPDLLIANGIDWRDVSNWKGCTATWDNELKAIEIVNYQVCMLYPGTGYFSIDTNQRYYVSLEYMTKDSITRSLYLGTKSYDVNKNSVLAHPGSYDYFGASGLKPTSTNVWNKVMNKAVNGQPRTGESATTSIYQMWHPGTQFAKMIILANYNSSQRTYIRNLKFFTE